MIEYRDGKWYLAPLKVEDVREAGLLKEDPEKPKDCRTREQMIADDAAADWEEL